MSGMGVLGLHATNPSLQYNKAAHPHPYGPSTSSSASSSSSSVFSLDGLSNQGSISSTSTNSVDVIWENDSESHMTGRGLVPPNEAGARCPQGVPRGGAIKVTDAVVPELRKHPRRTNSLVTQSNGASCPRAPPCLMRQSERKVNFVDNLVDTASQIVETIWPLSTTSLRNDPNSGCKNVLPLRTFIQETLRRSRTSYSTLQVALYYLIKIKPHVPDQDFTKEQPRDKQGCRAMQCGRRMFLAALILASKYLQDRNYSARAWSKISGLNTFEINQNELMFLGAVDWRLHIPDAIFQRWTDIVLKYTPGAGGPPVADGQNWRTIIPKLSPELDNLEMDRDLSSPESFGAFDLGLADSPSPRSVPAYEPANQSYTYEPPPSCARNPPTLEAPPRAEFPNPPLPSMPRLPMLPTPQMTPQTSTTPTPAASAGRDARRPSCVLAAMSEAQSACMARSTLDQRPSVPCKPSAVDGYPAAARRSSLARSTSSTSSPDSMVSDVSTLSSQSSRSSSISSNASGASAPSQPRLAVKAALRCTNNSKKENRKPLTIASPIDEGSLADMYESPESYTGPVGQVPDFSNFSLETPAGLNSTHEAAQSLCELSGAVSRPPSTSDDIGQRGCRKRGRTSSEDTILQNHVRYLIDISTSAEGSVQPDRNRAKSFMIPESSSRQSYDSTLQTRARQAPVELSGPAGMKRACCGSEARKIALNPTVRAEYLN